MTFSLSIRNAAADGPPPLHLAERDVVVGRAAEADWVVPDPHVSGRHLVIGFREGAYLLRDTSSNGSAINGRPVTGIHRLAPGDVIAIGGTEILFAEAPACASSGGAATVALPVARFAAGFGTLLRTRRRQLGELRVRTPDALARNPLAQEDPAAALGRLDDAGASAAIAEATAAIERHHAATAAAMQATVRAMLRDIAPDALAGAPGLPDGGEARDAALWRAYVARFEGQGQGTAGFLDRFATAFRDEYEALASHTQAGTAGPSSAPRRPS